jgi:hypothetical protein
MYSQFIILLHMLRAFPSYYIRKFITALLVACAYYLSDVLFYATLNIRDLIIKNAVIIHENKHKDITLLLNFLHKFGLFIDPDSNKLDLNELQNFYPFAQLIFDYFDNNEQIKKNIIYNDNHYRYVDDTKPIMFNKIGLNF